MQHISFSDPVVEAVADVLGVPVITAKTRAISPVVQTGVGLNNACGIACALMLDREVDKSGIVETLQKWGGIIDPAQDGTTPADLVKMLNALGNVATIDGKATYPYIELIQYDRLDHALQWSVYRGHKFLHWIVRVSPDVYFDPLFPQGQGGPLTTTKAILDGAEISALSRVAIVEKFIDKPMANIKATVKVEVRVRTGPEISANTWTPLALREGQPIDGVVENGWFKYSDPRFVTYDEGGKRIDSFYSIIKQGTTTYLSLPAATVPSVPPPVITPPAAVNLSNIGVNLLISHHLAEPAYASGIRVFQFMEGLMAASEFKQRHPECVVMYRKYIGSGGGIPDPSAFSGEAHVGHGVVFLSPLNECDNYCYGSPGEIEQRAKFDTAVAKMCAGRGTIYAAGGFSMGTPDFTNPAICEAMRNYYAPGYNAGLFAMNMHLYSPNMPHINDPNGWPWYERRWEFLFTKCGFNPSPNLLGIYCDETGVDEGGVGGFPAHGVGGEAVGAWAKAFTALSRAPLVVGGQSYPSPMRGAAIFQAGDTKNWAGFNIAPWFTDIGRASG